MKKFLPWIIVAVVVFGIYSWAKGFNNTAVNLKETATKTWGDVESSYQRRNDLIGNLVKTVQGAADFEKSTLEAVIKARSEASKPEIKINNVGDLTAEKLQAFNQAQSGLSSALSRLLVTVERYPDIKANQNFLELQSQLEGTENRINVARDRFNEAVEPYNKHIKTFPNSILAGILNFDDMSYYKAEAGSEKAPDVNFDFK
ncbi:MAG: LemA family protein [Flaviramulus sp.]|nr:LemA family protein [Flaviramulus sp.]NNC50827.1 LemA family protein [Flaviramulus sp.]